MSVGIVILSITILIMIVVVRIGGIALELTGLSPEVARFQALSAFTRTGFTTREAEEVVHNPQRRRIVSVLMLLGSAGVITLIAGLVEALQSTIRAEDVEWWQKVAQFAAAGLALYLLYGVFIWPRLARRIDQTIRRQLAQHTTLTPAEIEELLHSAEGWSIARVEVPEGCQFAGKTLAETRPRDQGILVVAIERDGKLIPSPHGKHSIQVGDHLIVYGKLTEIPELLRGQTRSADPATS